MTYTEDEIEAAARMITNLTTPETKWTPRELAIAALAAVPRVPAGHWIAPDVADEEMLKAAARKMGTESKYRAMRDVVKGRKP